MATSSSAGSRTCSTAAEHETDDAMRSGDGVPAIPLVVSSLSSPLRRPAAGPPEAVSWSSFLKAGLSDFYPLASAPISVAFMLAPFETLRRAPLPIVRVNTQFEFRL